MYHSSQIVSFELSSIELSSVEQETPLPVQPIETKPVPEQTPLKASTSSAISPNRSIPSNASGVPTSICDGGPVTSDLDAAAAAFGDHGVAAPEIVQFGEPVMLCSYDRKCKRLIQLQKENPDKAREIYRARLTAAAKAKKEVEQAKEQKFVASSPVESGDAAKIHLLSSVKKFPVTFIRDTSSKSSESSDSSVIIPSADTSIIAPSTPIIDKSQKIVPSCPVKSRNVAEIRLLSSAGILPGTKSKPNSNNSQASIPFPIASIDVPSASGSTPAVVASNAATNAELSSEFDRTSEEIRAYWSLAWNHSNWLPDHAQEILRDTSMMKKAFPGNLAMLCSYDRKCKRLIQLQKENPDKAREIYRARLTAADDRKCKRLIQLQKENPDKAREIYQARLTAAAKAKKEVAA
jgi:hypothetical protein